MEKIMQKLIRLMIKGMLVFSFLSAGCVSQRIVPIPDIEELAKEAEAGDAKAQFRLGAAYDFGLGVRSSGKDAWKWYRMAAEAGNADAQNSLGRGYQAENNYKQALIWFRKSAEQNHPVAITNLGYLHDLGLGVPQDRKKGYELYLRAAEMGWGDAMINIGQMFGTGQLGDVDLRLGCVWTIRALQYSAHYEAKKRASKVNGTYFGLTG